MVTQQRVMEENLEKAMEVNLEKVMETDQVAAMAE